MADTTRRTRLTQLPAGWTDLLDQGGLLLSVDPGANTGIVLLSVPPSLEADHCRWLGSRTVVASRSYALNEAACDRDFAQRIATAATQLVDDYMARMVEPHPLPIHLVFEEPLEATTAWRGHAKQGRGTAFRLGAAYGLALATIAHPMIRQVASYPPTNHGTRRGWMGGSSAEREYAVVQQDMRAIGAPRDGVSEHAMSACGVGLYHLAEIRQARQAARILAIKAASAESEIARVRAALAEARAAEKARKREERLAVRAAEKAQKALAKAAQKAALAAAKAIVTGRVG